MLLLLLTAVALAACSSADPPAAPADPAPAPSQSTSPPPPPSSSTPVDDGGGAPDALPDADPPSVCAWKRVSGDGTAKVEGGVLVIESTAPTRFSRIARLSLGQPMTGDADVSIRVVSAIAGDSAMFSFGLECGPRQGVAAGFYWEDGKTNTAIGVDGDTDIAQNDANGVVLRLTRSGATATATISRGGTVIASKSGPTTAPTACELVVFATSGSKTTPYRVELDDFVSTGLGACVDDFSRPATY